jgi:hypothetical protein
MNARLQNTILAFSRPEPDFNQTVGQHALQSQSTKQESRGDHACRGSKPCAADAYYETEYKLKGEEWSKILPRNLALVI